MSKMCPCAHVLLSIQLSNLPIKLYSKRTDQKVEYIQLSGRLFEIAVLTTCARLDLFLSNLHTGANNTATLTTNRIIVFNQYV